MALFCKTSASKPSWSSRSVNTVSKHWMPAARAARITCPRAPSMSTPSRVGLVWRHLRRSPPEMATPNIRSEAAQIS